MHNYTHMYLHMCIEVDMCDSGTVRYQVKI